MVYIWIMKNLILRKRYCKLSSTWRTFYNTVRYKNDHVLPNHIVEWQKKCMLHLQDQKYCYFERTVTVAEEMSRPYLLNNTITIVDIRDTETEQNIFAVQNMYSIVSCTQIYAASLLKYIYIFKTFITFIACNKQPNPREKNGNDQFKNNSTQN